MIAEADVQRHVYASTVAHGRPPRAGDVALALGASRDSTGA